jgi:hypothetical protein
MFSNLLEILKVFVIDVVWTWNLKARIENLNERSLMRVTYLTFKLETSLRHLVKNRVWNILLL